MADDTIPRRNFLKAPLPEPLRRSPGRARADADARTRGASGAAGDLPGAHAWLTLNATEAAFIVATVDTLIPADQLSPSGSDCGVAVFIDRQLAGAYGNGARLYRQGPFPKAKPSSLSVGAHAARVFPRRRRGGE